MRRMYSRFPTLILIICLALLVAACGGDTDTEEPADESPDTPVTETATETPEPVEEEMVDEEPVAEEMADEFEGELTIAIWGQIDSDPNHSSYPYHEVLQQWNDLHPNVELKYEVIGGTTVPDRFNWISTNMAAQSLPDVVMIYFPNDSHKEPDLVYDLTADLQQPNPYSDNPRWIDDFPYDAQILNDYAGPNGEYFFVGPTLSGDTGVTAIVYNKTIFDEVGVEPPETWAEFLDIQQQIKDAGHTPFFQPMAGPLGWLIGWPDGATMGQLMDEVIQTCDVDAPFDRINDKEFARCVKNGEIVATDPRHMESWRLMKEWSQYWQEGFLAPPPEGDPFAQGKVAMAHTMNLWIGRVANNPDIDFEWGTFYQPPVTADSTEYATGVPIRRVGNLGNAASGSQFLLIPMTTVENGKLEMARDLAQWTTAPAQLQYWCERQPIPCFDAGTPIEEVYPDDPTTWTQMRGFFEPGSFQRGVRGFGAQTLGQDVNTQALKLMQDYFGDALTLEEAMEELQVIYEDATEQLILEHPEWDAADW